MAEFAFYAVGWSLLIISILLLIAQLPPILSNFHGTKTTEITYYLVVLILSNAIMFFSILLFNIIVEKRDFVFYNLAIVLILQFIIFTKKVLLKKAEK